MAAIEVPDGAWVSAEGNISRTISPTSSRSWFTEHVIREGAAEFRRGGAGAESSAARAAAAPARVPLLVAAAAAVHRAVCRWRGAVRV